MAVDGTKNISSLKLSLARSPDWKVQVYAAVVAALIRDHVVPKHGLAVSLKKQLALQIARSLAGDAWSGYDDRQRMLLVDKYEAAAKRIAEKSVAVFTQARERGLDFRSVSAGSLIDGQERVREWLERLGVTTQDSLFAVFGFSCTSALKTDNTAEPKTADSVELPGDIELRTTIKREYHQMLLARAAREATTVDALIEQWVGNWPSA